MKRFLPFLLIPILAASAQARTTTYDWEGRVTTPNWKIALDTLVSGTVEIDDQGPRLHEQEGIEYYHAVRFTFSVAGERFDSIDQRTWAVTPFGQSMSDGYLVHDSPVYYSFNWGVATRANKLDLLAAHTLDQDWVSGGWGMEVSDPDRGYFADGFEGIIDSLRRRTNPDEYADGGDAAPVPEPSSFLLLGTALAGLAGYRARRKSRP